MECGVYRIKCIVNSKSYIGSSSNINYRWSVHRNKLKNNLHYSPQLQASWNKYGALFFCFEIIEICDNQIRYEREQFYLDKYQSYDYRYGFNTSRIAGRSPGTGKPVTFVSPNNEVVHYLNVKECATANKLPHSIMCSVASGKRLHYRGWHLPSVKINYQPHRLLSPKGEVHQFDCVADFAKEHNISQQMMYRILNGKASIHKGWRPI